MRVERRLTTAVLSGVLQRPAYPEGNGSGRERMRRRTGREVGAMIRSALRRYGPPDQHPARTAQAR